MREVKHEKIKRCLLDVYQSLERYGYNPVNQLIGYLISGDPTYITAKERARYKIQEFDREDILAEIVGCFFEGLEQYDDARGVCSGDTLFFLKQVI